MCKKLRCCRRPPEPFDDIVLRPVKASPADFLGYKRKCCGCIKLKTAAILICILSFAWCAYELQTAESFISKIFPSENLKQVMSVANITYILIVVIFVFSSGLFLLGIITKYEFVNTYVWCGFIFVCICVVLSVIAATVQTIAGSGKKQSSMTIVFAVIWYSFFIYCLMVVNSYKMTLW